MTAVVAILLVLIELATGRGLRRDLVGQAVHAWIGIAVPAAILSSSHVAEVVIAVLGIVLLVAVWTRSTPPTLRTGRRAELLREARDLEARWAREESEEGAHRA